MTVLEAIVLLLVIPLHELGHFIAAKYFDWDPKFEIKKLAFVVKYYTPVEHNKLKLYFTSFCGILGIVPLLLYGIFVDLSMFQIILFLISYTGYELVFKRKQIKEREK